MCEYRGGKPPCAMKVTEVGLACNGARHNPPATILREQGLSVSMCDKTRKVSELLPVYVVPLLAVTRCTYK